METIIFYSSDEAMRLFGTWTPGELRQFFEFTSPGFGKTVGKHAYSLEEDPGSMLVRQETPWFDLDDSAFHQRRLRQFDEPTPSL